MSVTITDLFCGAGGSSLGAELAGGTLRLGLNHWERAIETHATNFQHADHDCEDVSSLTTAQIRRYPDSDILLASPECTNHSLAKGARRRKPQAGSLFEDGPAGDSEQDRSRATMWDVVRFAEQKRLKGKPYKAIVVENVVDAFKWGYDDDGGLFDAWLQAMRALGYEHEIVWLNSMFAGMVPQSRDRMYVVFWLKTLRRPNLRVEPIAWCPHCEAVVEGRQRWKKPGARVWGRYGAQYLYGCPDCNGVVLPGAFPAANAIDWSLPAPRIGDRERPLADATRERIRRGLEKLVREPFAIRRTHGGVPRPLTLPIATLTQRHDMAMVMPVAGNTHERTPGNRAKDAATDPLATVHATPDRAIVVPPMGDVNPRDAHTLPAPTQTTTTRPALVTGYVDGGVARIVDEEPINTFRAGGGSVGLVYANRNNGVPKPAHESPSAAICTGGHIGVVIRNNTARGNAGQMASPAHEPIRTLTGRGHQSLVVPFSRRGVAAIADQDQVRTITQRDKLALVIPYDRTGDARPAGELPTQTLTTRDRAALVITEQTIDESGFRMFALHEIAVGMAMHLHVTGGHYTVVGNKRERMAQYGNAVTPPAMELLVGRLLEVLG